MPDSNLTNSLTKMTSEELDKKYSDLTHRFDVCRRLNLGQNVQNQILDLIGLVTSEKDKRLQELMKQEEKQVVVDTDPIEVYVQKPLPDFQ